MLKDRLVDTEDLLIIVSANSFNPLLRATRCWGRC